MSDFLMPSLGADMESAVLVEWLVAPGARMKRGDIIAVVETDKGAIEIEVFEDCEVMELVAVINTEVKVDGLLARLRTAHEVAAVVAPATPARAIDPPPAVPPHAAPAAPSGRPPSIPVGMRASPAARRRAAVLGIPLAGLRGTGVGGAICLADVEAAPKPGRQPRGGFEPQAMRRAIGNAMQRAKREIPHFYLVHPVPLAAALEWLARENGQRPVPERLLPAVLLLKATARALARVPALNGHFEDGVFTPGAGIHIGWAISLRGGGLIAPAIQNVDQLTLIQLMAALRDLVQRARNGGLRSSELMKSTITVTSLGDRSAETVLPIIYPPQVAMIGFGSIIERPCSVAGRVVSQPVVSVTLAADHRVSDGHGGGQLLTEIETLLQHPESL